jgi:Asp-tRNA(Asn)/Glu-tRNA(Gln) amidotransferase A subunit family amidase
LAVAIEVFRKLAAEVRDLTSPVAAASVYDIWTKVAGAESYAYHSQWLSESPEKYQPATRRRLSTPTVAGVQGDDSAEMKASVYLQARRQLDLMRRQIPKLFADVDVLITPTVPNPQSRLRRSPIRPPSVSATPLLLTSWGCPRFPCLAVSPPPVCPSVSRLSGLHSRSQQFWC